MKIQKSRDKINKIDKKIAKLFEKRMKLSEKIAKYKNKVQMPITDKEREQTVMKNFEDQIEDKELLEYADELIENIMSISKKYQEEVIKYDNES